MCASSRAVVIGSSVSWADRLGIWASGLCVVHCILTPVLLSFSVVLAHLLPSEERVHRTLALTVAMLGAIALLRGFRKHRRARVLLLMAAGLGCIFAAAWWGDLLPSHWAEVAITFLGSSLMITAHRMNHTFCKQCVCAD
ncbi:MerC domain-containing protein [Acidicapsa ligni]|uniref:MerC domain-containing protein n=1 Tax=Acidicapsa ligni TaxID=542300 RepID=UPI0021DF60F0|nr:MerC domain-containing protein [Acidicapsa ligni]